MEVTINGKVIQYNMDFRKEYPNIFKILNDENYEIFCINNNEEDDIVIFVSPNQRMIETIYMSDFENYLRKLNKKIFFNILSLFNDCFDIDENSSDITECKLVQKEEFLKGFNINYEFKQINIIFKNNICYIYISPEDEVGTLYDIETEKRKKIFLNKINSLTSNKKSKLFYNAPNKKLMVINTFTGELKPLDIELTNDEMQYIQNLPQVKETWNKTYFCDAREFIKICKNKEMKAEDCNFFVDNKVLYICFVKDAHNFKNMAEVAKYLYNNQNTKIMDEIKSKTGCNDLVYLFNGDKKDCILCLSNNSISVKILEDLNIEENYSDIISAFNKKDIIDINQLDTQCLLFLKIWTNKKVPERAIETNKYYIWADFFSKTLFAAKKKLQ